MSTWIKKDCESCGYRRRVKIDTWGNDEPRYARLCTACQKEVAARQHLRQAQKLQNDARAIRAKRRK